jgi:glutathione peroxidase
MKLSRLAVAGLLFVASLAIAGDKKMTNALDFKMKDIDGKEVDLAKKYQGKVVLLVNVASKCGYTPQYEGLEKLHEKLAPKGLCIVGVPANNFGGQEPGTESEIKQFCSTKYGVKFDMLSKVSVKGDDMCPLYKFLTSKETNPQHGGEVKWNFEKFLISKDGKVVGHYSSKVKPDDAEMNKAIEAELAK